MSRRREEREAEDAGGVGFGEEGAKESAEESPSVDGRPGSPPSNASCSATLPPAPKSDAASPPAQQRRPWWRLFRMALSDWPFLLAAMAGAAASGALNPVFGICLASVVFAYFNPDVAAMQQEVDKWALVVAGLGVACLGTYAMQHYAFAVVGERLVTTVRRMMMTAFLRNEVAWFDAPSNSSGAVAGRLASSSSLVRAAVTDRISVAVQDVALVAVAFAVAFGLSWRMALASLAVFPLLVAAFFVEQAFYQNYSADLLSAHEDAARLATEAIANIRTVAAFSLQAPLGTLFQRTLAAPLRQAVTRGHIAGFGIGFCGFLLFSSYAFSFWVQTLIVPQYSSYATTFKVFFIVVMTSLSISEALSLAPDLVKGGAALRSFFSSIDRRPAFDPDDPTAEALPPDSGALRGEIELRRVRFAYPTRPDALVFRCLDLRVPAGTSLALVGRSGSGKSSVAALVERFYDPLRGAVLVDGRDIRGFNLRSLRRHIALVSQEPALFSTSIRTNILFGREGASEVELLEAAKAANAHAFISALPDGYDTQVGKRGAQLSGGQKQRVAIARAVLKSPAILLLDEATSALDAEAERQVQVALQRLLAGRTSVVIAHRLSTVQAADRIAVLQEGRVAEEGTHAELMGREGSAYRMLVQLQGGRGEDERGEG